MTGGRRPLARAAVVLVLAVPLVLTEGSSAGVQFLPARSAAGPFLPAGSANLPYVDGPPPAHTGGFGEPNCHRCHFDYPPNDGEARVTVRELPAEARPGSVHRLEVLVVREDLERAGFQLSIRWADGPAAGRPAGRLEAADDRVQVVRDDSTGVPYAEHTVAGTAPVAPGTARWRVTWRVPAILPAGPGAGSGGAGRVAAVHVAVNAANGDDSEFGDHVYTRSAAVRVSPPDSAARASVTARGGSPRR